MQYSEEEKTGVEWTVLFKVDIFKRLCWKFTFWFQFVSKGSNDKNAVILSSRGLNELSISMG